MLKLNYKHLGIFAIGTLLSFSSCDNDSDENDNYISLDQVYAIMDGDNHDDLKSYQQGCVLPEHGIHNKWSNEPGKDDIALFTYEKGPDGKYISTDTKSYALYSLDEGFHTASFKAKNDYLTVKTNCPVLAAHNGNWTIKTNGTYHMGYSINTPQNFVNGRNENAMPMIAKTYVNANDPVNVSFKFENLASIIRFDVTPDSTNESRYVKSIHVEGSEINGNWKAYYESDVLKTERNGDGGDIIDLTCDPNALEIEGIKSYTMVIAPIEDTDLKIIITTSDNITKTLQGKTSIERNTFKKVSIDLNELK